MHGMAQAVGELTEQGSPAFEPLGQQILFSSRFAEAAGRCDGRLESLGHFQLRGVDEAKEIFGLRLSQTAALQREEA
jgi:class 3 adenylate cyclase